MFIVSILLTIIIGCVHSQTELTLSPLPYAYNALEPVLSEQLMRLHHDKHFQTYTNRSNIALKAMFVDPQNGGKLKDIAQQPIEVILTQLQNLPDHYHLALRHNGGGYLNHKLFFSMLKTPTATAAENQPTGPLFEAIEKSFGSFEKFKELFSVASVNLFGSGWVWLYIDARTKQLVLNFTANQDNP
jgi:Fe-Mn family superoxide dismutase